MFSIPTTNSGVFWEMITGDSSASAGSGYDSTADNSGAGVLIQSLTTVGTYLKITMVTSGLTQFTSDAHIGKIVTISGITSGDDDDDFELDLINGDHIITDNDGTTITLDTVFDVNDIAGTLAYTNSAILISGNGYAVGADIDNSYRILQTHGLSFASRYDGMMAQSATINITPDDVASVDIAFVGKDETTKVASAVGVGTLFKGNGSNNPENDSPFIHSGDGDADSPYKIDKINPSNTFDGVFDNFVDFYPSYSASLYLAKKTTALASPGNPVTVTWNYLDADLDNDGFSAHSASTSASNYWASGETTPGSSFLIPFSDASISIANNIEFPTYINGTNTRTKPAQTGFKDITIGLSIPYNQFTFPMIQSMFDEDSWACKVVLQYSATGVTSTKQIMIDLPEMCITGDGGLGDIPEGEIVLPLTFTAYAPHEITTTEAISQDGTGYDPIQSKAPMTIYVTE